MPTTIPTEARMRVVHATSEQLTVMRALFPPTDGGPEAELILVVSPRGCCRRSARRETLKGKPNGETHGDGERIRSVGRLRYLGRFEDVWVGGVHYDLRHRNTARFCIQYLVEAQAFDPTTARHLENEIDPFVRKHANLPALPASADGNLRIQRYFNDPVKKYHGLRKELVKSAGRNGCFYLRVK